MASRKRPTVTTTPTRYLTLADLLAPGDLTKLDIPELNGHVYIRAASAGAVMDFLEAGQGKLSMPAMLSVVAQSIVSEDGSPLFQSADDVAQLRNARMDVYTRLANAVTDKLGLAPAAPVTNAAADNNKGEGEGEHEGTTPHPLSAGSDTTH